MPESGRMTPFLTAPLLALLYSFVIPSFAHCERSNAKQKENFVRYQSRRCGAKSRHGKIKNRLRSLTMKGLSTWTKPVDHVTSRPSCFAFRVCTSAAPSLLQTSMFAPNPIFFAVEVKNVCVLLFYFVFEPVSFEESTVESVCRGKPNALLMFRRAVEGHCFMKQDDDNVDRMTERQDLLDNRRAQLSAFSSTSHPATTQHLTDQQSKSQKVKVAAAGFFFSVCVVLLLRILFDQEC